MKRMVGLASTVLVIIVSACPWATAAPKDSAERAYGARILALMNSARSQAGVASLKLAAGTTQISDAWVATIAQSQTLEANPDLKHQLEAHGSRDVGVYGEIVGTGVRANPQKAYDDFATSESNRSAMLSPEVRYIGISAAFDDNVSYVVADFVDTYIEEPPAAAPLPVESPSPASTPTAEPTATPTVAEPAPLPSDSPTAAEIPTFERPVTTAAGRSNESSVGFFSACAGVLDGFLIVVLALVATPGRRRHTYYE